MSQDLATVEPMAVAELDSEVIAKSDGQLLVIAEQPGQMAAAQESLIEWAKAKVASLHSDMNVIDSQVSQAKAYGIRASGLSNIVSRISTEISYYEKVLAALEDGHCIVPNFPGDVVAIRTSQDFPTGSAHTHGWNPSLPQQSESLDIGEGKYVSPQPSFRKERAYSTDKQGQMQRDGEYTIANKFRSVALPVKFMKPRLLDATQAALAKKVFDEICTVDGPRSRPREKADPMILGRIRGPKGKMLSFLIGWFIDTRDL